MKLYANCLAKLRIINDAGVTTYKTLNFWKVVVESNDNNDNNKWYRQLT